MFNAYPEQQRVRCGKKRVLLIVFSCGGLAVLLCAEQAFQKERRAKHTEMKDVHFLQPFVYSPGFEVGLWTWQKGYMPSTTIFQPTTQKRVIEPADDKPAAPEEVEKRIGAERPAAPEEVKKRIGAERLAAPEEFKKRIGAETEVARLRAELEVERQRSAELERLVDEARTQKGQGDAVVSEQRSGMHKERSDTETGKQKGLLDEATELETTLMPIIEVKKADSEKVGEKVHIPSSLFRQPPSVEESSPKVVQFADRPTPTVAPPSIVTEVVSQPAAKEASSPSVVASNDGQQPTITLKAGGSEIHVKLGEVPVVPQQQVPPAVRTELAKEEPIAATTTPRTASQPPAVDLATTTLPTKSAEKPSLGIVPKAEALPVSSTTTAAESSESAPSAGPAKTASQGTSITLKSQGQTITIEIGSGSKEQKSEAANPSVQQPTAPLAIAPPQVPPSKAVAAQEVLAAPATVSMAVPAQLPKPIGTPSSEVLSIPSAIVRQPIPEYNTTDKIQVPSPQPTSSTTITMTVTTDPEEDKDADRYANLAMRAR